MGSWQVLALVHEMFQNSHAEIVKALFMGLLYFLPSHTVLFAWPESHKHIQAQAVPRWESNCRPSCQGPEND